MRIVQPPGWPRPKGYSNGIVASGTMVFLAGIVGWTEDQVFASDDFVAQARQTLANIVTLLDEAGSKPEHIVRMTWFVADRREYLARQKELGDAYIDTIGRHFPAMAVLEISGFVEDGAKLEIETTAIIPGS